MDSEEPAGTQLIPVLSQGRAGSCKSKAGTGKEWSVFELQEQYLVLQNAGVFRAKHIETFASSVQDRQALSGPHWSGRCKTELSWDFAQDNSLTFWRFSQSL